MNWWFLILFGIVVLALIVFLVVKNLKDEHVMEDQMNNNYPKPKDGENEAETEETPH
jgi:large-conductance mechanosensitive channel